MPTAVSGVLRRMRSSFGLDFQGTPAEGEEFYGPGCWDVSLWDEFVGELVFDGVVEWVGCGWW